MEELRAVVAPTPLGDLTVVASSLGVVATFIGGPEEAAASLERPVRPSPRGLAGIRREVVAYFAGRLTVFRTPVDLSLAPRGFSRRVLEETLRIPYGELRTYGDVAEVAGSPRAGRAAGSALARCPIELFVPCHRVVGAARDLGGYGGHEERKRFLLRLEGWAG
jgi:methylated-DNA-[protein]-cysteine S-methyltransferase